MVVPPRSLAAPESARTRHLSRRPDRVECHVVTPAFGVLRPWGNLDLYSRVERIELWLYLAFAIWIWWRLGICDACPRWADDPDSSCGRYMTLGGTGFMALLGFAILRAHFGPLPERPTRRD